MELQKIQTKRMKRGGDVYDERGERSKDGKDGKQQVREIPFVDSWLSQYVKIFQLKP